MTHARGWLMGLTFLTFLLTVLPAVATPGPTRLVIVSARVDVTAGTLTIDGHDFDDGPLTVTLNGMPLAVMSVTASEIVATLPAGLDPGTYLLTASVGPAVTQFDSFNVTLGAVGPQGPTGPQGPPGTFSGHFQSPNGSYSLDVTDTGIRLAGPSATIQLANGTVTIMVTNLTVRSSLNTDIRSGDTTTIRSASNTDVRSDATLTLRSGANTNIQADGVTAIQGVNVLLNGGGHPAARFGDAVQVDTASGQGTIQGGSTTVFIGD